MSLITITSDQRYELGEALAVAANKTQRFINDPKPIGADVATPIEPSLQAASDALNDAGYGPELPATQAVVSNGATLSVHTTTTGGDPHPATLSVSDGVVNYALLADSVILVDQADNVRVTNSAGATISSAATVSVVSGALNRISLPATIAGLANAGTATISNSAGTTIGTGTAVVAAGVITRIALPATIAGVANAATVVVQNSAGAQAHNATATVAAGLVSNVKLAATAAIVDNAQALTVPVTGTYATTATLTVANGVITGIALS